MALSTTEAHMKMFAMDTAIKVRKIDYPIMIDTKILPQGDVDTKRIMDMMQNTSYTLSNTPSGKDYMDLILEDADKIYKWLIK